MNSSLELPRKKQFSTTTEKEKLIVVRHMKHPVKFVKKKYNLYFYKI